MKKLFVLTTVLLLSLGLALQAQANVFDSYGHYQIKFEGFEYAHTGNFDDFKSGSAGLLGGSQLVNPDYSPASGFNMSGILYFTTVINYDPVSGDTHYPPLYEAGSGGLYVAVLRDLHVASGSGNILAETGGHITFSGGNIDWYYAAGMTVSDVNTLKYQAGTGLVDKNNNAFDWSSFGSPFASFSIFDEAGDAWASVSLDHYNRLTGKPQLYADAPSGSIFNSNNFSGHDMFLHATLTWYDSAGRFHVNDPAYVAVPTPEPASVVLMGLGGLLIAGFAVRRRKAA